MIVRETSLANSILRRGRKPTYPYQEELPLQYTTRDESQEPFSAVKSLWWYQITIALFIYGIGSCESERRLLNCNLFDKPIGREQVLRFITKLQLHFNGDWTIFGRRNSKIIELSRNVTMESNNHCSLHKEHKPFMRIRRSWLSHT